MDETPIIFEDWEAVLRTAVLAERQRAYREAIVKFRDERRPDSGGARSGRSTLGARAGESHS